MRVVILAAALAACPALSFAATATATAMTPRGVPIATQCQGPLAAKGHKIARDFDLGHLYDGNSNQLVVTAPSKACPGGTMLDVYEQARSGTWGSLLEKPLCAASVSFGPKNPWGAWMLTIDGRHYDQRGAYYTPATY